MQQSFNQLKKKSWQSKMESAETRIRSLRKLEQVLIENENKIIEALAQDFQKPAQETLLTEIYPLREEIHFAVKNLKKWMQPQKVSSPWTLLTTRCSVMYESKGVSLIIAPWNYPLQLALGPLIPALAAGNTVMIKPSELTPHTSRLIAEMIKAAFPPDQVMVVEGGLEVSQKILELPFDHIFFTGSTQVGKVVMKAAAQHLSAVTLELGGKSPTLIDETADLKTAAEKIAWGKFLNGGQTCVAPDYILIQENVFADFCRELKKTLRNFYPDAGEKSMAHVISDRHWARLDQLLSEALEKGARLESGGQKENSSRFLSPTVLSDVSEESLLMREEIFGPLLPILKYQDLSQAIAFIQKRPKPLALYLFSRSSANTRRVLRETSSGGVCVNETVMHLGNPHLPFGGIGESGLGNYHGFFGFKAFSHEKAILRQTYPGKYLRFLYPPLTGFKERLLRWILSLI
jgi:aldehyde dehydrogenase (NAD+)